MSAKSECIKARPRERSWYDALCFMNPSDLSTLRDLCLLPAFYRKLFLRRSGKNAGQNLAVCSHTKQKYASVPLIEQALLDMSDGSPHVPTLQSLATEVRRMANQVPYSFFAEAKHLLSIKPLLYKKRDLLTKTLNIPCKGFGNYVDVDQVPICDKASLRKEKQFFVKLAQEVKRDNLAGNAYRKVAAEQFEYSLQSVIKRGLSSILDCHNVDAATATFLLDLKQRGTDRQIGKENDVMYIALSYKYEQKDGLSQEKWKEVVGMLTSVGKRLGYDKIRIWVDRIAVTCGMKWSSVGFVPYFIYPTFVHPNADEFTNRLWIELEKFAAALGPGVLTVGTKEDDVMQHLIVTRSPIETLLAFAEVLTSGCLNDYEITFERDRNDMVAWAKSVLTTKDTNQILTMPRHDLEERGDERNDVSMMCLFDDDITVCDPAREYIKRTEIFRDGEHDGWDGVEEIIGRSELPNSRGIAIALENQP